MIDDFKRHCLLFETSFSKYHSHYIALNCNASIGSVLVKSVEIMVRLHIFSIFSFLAKMLSFLLRDDNIFARNENTGKICKQTIT